MPDVNSTYSQNNTIDAKVFVENTKSAIQNGLGKISDAISSGTSAVKLKISSAFPTKDMEKIKGSGRSEKSPEETKNAKAVPASAKMYPARMDHYAMFTFIKYERGFALETPKDTHTFVAILPVPSNLNDQFDVDYATPSLGPVAGAIAGSTIKGMRQAHVGGASPSGGDIAVDAATVGVLTGAGALGKAAGEAVGSSTLGDNAKMLAGASMGVAPNPYLAVLFQNMGLRQHQFSYRFAPHSAAELATIKEIIKQFKVRMLPGMTSGTDMLFTYPDLCDISFSKGTLPDYKIKRCVLKSLSVNYGPNGPSFFKTGDPTVVEINLTFMEVSPFTRRDLGASNEPVSDADKSSAKSAIGKVGAAVAKLEPPSP